MAMQSVSEALAQFVVATRFSAIQLAEQSEALRYTRYALLDGLGVSLAATTLGEGCQAFFQHAVQQGAIGECSLWGSGRKTSASLAAFANGALAHALDFEDTHDGALVHPNAAVIPAALAVAQARDTLAGNSGKKVSGEELLTAIAIGCEVVCRLGSALTVPLDRFGWYPPPMLSAFGATAAAARLYGLTVPQVLDAFSLTLLQATSSGEIKYNPESVIRAIRDAFPAQTGVVSAQLAQQGVKGFAQPFEGKAGFFANYARGQYDVNQLTQDLGKTFAIAQLSFKPWPSCRGTHVFIHLLSRLMQQQHQQHQHQQQQWQASDIHSIQVYGNGINRMLAEPLADKQQPRTTIDAKFSIPYCLAWTALHGEPTLTSFLPEALNNPEVVALAKRISYHVDETISDSGPGMLQGRIVVTTQNKQQVELRGDSAPGAPSNPLSEEELLNKFFHCASFSAQPLSSGDASQLAASILCLEQADDLQTALFRFL